MTLRWMKIALVALALAAWAGVSPGLAQGLPGGGIFGEEDRDWNVPPTQTLRKADYHAPTPRSIPGGRVVTTGELAAMLTRENRPWLIDVLGGGMHRTISGAFWMSGAGDGEMTREEEQRFLKALGSFSGGDKSRPFVFFCVDAECWLSYNAALRAIAAGYTNVMWYRGGIAAWRMGGQLMSMSDPFAW